jgi:hypothetical protein
MRWVAPTEKDTANQTLEKRLWAAADTCVFPILKQLDSETNREEIGSVSTFRKK